ncbi:histidine phosphatase family protein [Glycomyces sp. TRM65418]|uniref:histidine phosphatase family protein n=1 Tax=Glycomyces sp. TRM65418 TaxID=2867006 RepID=UPI001CE5D12F|nr:histidine phosphatase family protein [Glycomyces sp. TRM65418]MCC3763698.1 histidine phosphatase family protein [Glycomyces sp. TRM65418]QZD57677.1 histidine phosphatase family protein [Glycomyces sp. TRM65418]
MLSALILLRHVALPGAPEAPLTETQSRRARALADFLQLYNPTILLSGPGRACADTLAPLAGRLDLPVTASDDLSADTLKLPGPAHAAVWLAAKAIRTLPDPRRTAVVCAEGIVLAALLVAVAARDGHDLSTYDLTVPLDGPDLIPPGGGWVLHRDDGRLADVKALAVR